MSGEKSFSFFVVFFSFIILCIIPGAFSHKLGTHLGELCDYRRVCLDVNAKCKGQVVEARRFLERRDHPFKYRCECKTFYKEDGGKCEKNIKATCGLVGGISCILGPVIILIMLCWIKCIKEVRQN